MYWHRITIFTVITNTFLIRHLYTVNGPHFRPTAGPTIVASVPMQTVFLPANGEFGLDTSDYHMQDYIKALTPVVVGAGFPCSTSA